MDALRRLGLATAGERARLEEQIRAAPAVHADETGWRENGQSGYVWVRATPDGTCLYTDEHSRASAVAHALLDECMGVRCTDFYLLRGLWRAGAHAALLGAPVAGPACAHGGAPAGPEQSVQDWATALHALYEHGQACSRQELSGRQRGRAYRRLEDRTQARARCYADTPDHPCRTLAQRLRHQRGEFVEFVRVPEVSATNNEAERRLRPLVIARTISGGTRSPQGTQTRRDLAGLVQTWHARGLNPVVACYSLLHVGLYDAT